MSFNQTFNSSNKFMLGSTTLKSLPSTSRPTLSINNDDDLVISSSSIDTMPTTATNLSNVITTVQHNNNSVELTRSSDPQLSDDLINLLENISHLSLKPDDDEIVSKLMVDGKQTDGVDDDVSPESSDEEVINEKKTDLVDMSEDVEPVEEESHAAETSKSADEVTLAGEVASTRPEEVPKSEPVEQEPETLLEPMQPETQGNDQVTPQNDKFEEDKPVPFDFQKFLKQLKSKDCEPIVKYIKSFMKQFALRAWSIDEQTKLIKDFEHFIYKKFIEIDQFKNLKPADLSNVKEGFEKLIMSRLYTQVFPPALASSTKLTPSHKEELIQDLRLLENLIKFQWIQNKHLDIPDSLMENSKSFITLSANELNKLNNYKSPRDKIICVLNCCKVIFGLIRKQQANSKLEENADTFVPLLIFVILKAKPKHLISNIGYIERFRDIDFLGGESMYYLSSLQLLANFIVKVDYKLLTIDEEEFNSNVAKVELDLKLKKEAKEKEKRNSSPLPASLVGKFNDERLQDLSPSQILATSANALQQRFNQIFTFDDEEGQPSNATDERKLLSQVKKLSLKEHEKQVNEDKDHEDVFANLKSIFPNIEDDILRDILAMKDYNIGECIESCLELLS